MKKILKNKIFQVVLILLVVASLVLLCFFNRIDEDVVTRVSKVLGYKYYKIECISEKCDYVAAYKGSKKGNTEIRIINSNGKTVVKYKEDYSKTEYKRVPVAATTNYAILAKKDNKGYTTGYVVVNSKGKEILTEDDTTLFVITNELFYSEKDNLYTVYDYTGKIIYDGVKELTFYNNNKIVTFVSSELNIMNDKSERILDGYKIVEEVKNDDETLYLVIGDQNNNYYFFDVKNNKIVGDSFNSYIVMSNNKLLITKKINNEVKKYLLNTKGESEKEVISNSDIYDKLTKNIDKDTYKIIDDSVFSINQKGLLVKNTKDNSIGTYEIKTGNYNKLFSFKEGIDGEINVYTLYESLDEVYLQVGCSSSYCNEENILVFNPISNKVSFNITGFEKEIKNYREYSGNYKVVTYTDKTYGLFDDSNNEILTSENNIVVIDQEILIDDDFSKSNVLLYSSKDKKLLNNNDNLAILDEKSNYKIYKIFEDKYLYLYSLDGVLIKKIPIESSSVSFGDKYALYIENNNVNVINLMKNKTKSLDITTKQLVLDSNGAVIPPYKGAIVITDTNDNTVKVFNYNKKMIKKIKNSKVESVGFDEENNKIFLITKQDKNYGLFIIK